MSFGRTIRYESEFQIWLASTIERERLRLGDRGTLPGPVPGKSFGHPTNETKSEGDLG